MISFSLDHHFALSLVYRYALDDNYDGQCYS